jgi:tRNA pseudouridine38-40 synthase
VHATGQVAHFVLRKKEWDPGVLRRGLNSLLAPKNGPSRGIQALSVDRVPIEFHAQRSATHKQYAYYFQQGPAPSPHLMPLSWWIRKPLDVSAMNEALAVLVGEHDFRAFQARGAPEDRSTVRRILEAEVTRLPVVFPGETGLEWVRLRIVGTGFLKQMVRGIAGTLLEIGEGRRPASDMVEILRAQDRALVGQTAPGRGLWLEKVWYSGYPVADSKLD